MSASLSRLPPPSPPFPSSARTRTPRGGQAHLPPPPPAGSREVSAALSRYTAIGQIGRGGMAEAILAEMRVGRGLTKLVVLKRMWPDLVADPDFVALFVREARLGARMNHPNLVQTYDVIDDGRRPTIVMEYLDGQSLARILGRLSGTEDLGLTSRLRITTSVLAALEYAHELTDYTGGPNGVVHRDANPQNVFVTYGGQVKLLDFGVAKSLAGAYQTRPGTVKGKLGYMAPEQVVGTTADRRADLFAVGVMLWEMIARRRMWQGMTDGQIVRHLATAAPMPALPPVTNLPRGLEAICARALAVRPRDRYSSAAEFAGALERLLVGSEDAHRRHLGRVVAVAFEQERGARRALIERHIDAQGAPGVSDRADVGSGLPAEVGPPPIAPFATPALDEGTAVVAAEGDDAPDLAAVNASAADGSAATQQRLTARVHFGTPWRSWHWAAAGMAAVGLLVFAGAVLPRLSRTRAAHTVRDAQAAVTVQKIETTAMGKGGGIPRLVAEPTRPAIVIAPMERGTEEPALTPGALSCPTPAVAVVPRPRAATARPAPGMRLAARDDEEVPLERAAPAKQTVRRQPQRDGETQVQDDDVLQPSVDLSQAASSPAEADAMTASSVGGHAVPASPRLARRSPPRPLDETDPFWQ